MSAGHLDCVEVDPGGAARHSVIWLHGLGADGHDFEPIVPYLGLDRGLRVRFVFPHAPRRAVTVNRGLIMPAWYDIRGGDLGRDEDGKGILDSSAGVIALIARENERGVPSQRIVLAGFSQGGAIALHVGLRHPDRLAGILALSTYLVREASLEADRAVANAGTCVFMAHGEFDPMVPPARGAAARDRLRALGWPVTWRSYPMGHEVCAEELDDIGAWLRDRLTAGI